MVPDAYKLGGLDAVLAFGIKAAGLAPALIGAGLGYLAAPDDEKEQGAMLGGLGMLGLTSGMHGTPAPVARPAPRMQTPMEALKSEAFVEGQARNRQLQEWLKGPAGVPISHYFTPRSSSDVPFGTPGPVPPKIAIDLGGSIPIPGLGGLGMSFQDKRERLPGMGRWVPRDTLERTFEGIDNGTDPESVIKDETERGAVVHPMVASALAAALAHKFAPQSGMGGKLLAGLGGAGAGALYHHATKDHRQRDAQAAVGAVQREREKFPVQKHPHQTANEAAPIAVSGANGDT